MTKARRFAEGTEVPVTKTRDELERLLTSHGAAQIRIDRDFATGRASVVFAVGGRMLRLNVRVDCSDLPDVKKHFPDGAPRGWHRWGEDRRKEWCRQLIEQRERESWRRLLLVVKGKLELVAGGDTTIEREFLADILSADGSTVYEAIAPLIDRQYRTGEVAPLMLPAKGGG